MTKLLAAGRRLATLGAFLIVFLGSLAAPAAAQTGAPLLDPGLQGQLERWLGAGPLYLENVYRQVTTRSPATRRPTGAAATSP